MSATCQHHSPGVASSPPTTLPDLYVPFTPQTYLLVTGCSKVGLTCPICGPGTSISSILLKESCRLMVSLRRMMSNLRFCSRMSAFEPQQVVFDFSHLKTSLISALPARRKPQKLLLLLLPSGQIEFQITYRTVPARKSDWHITTR